MTDIDRPLRRTEAAAFIRERFGVPCSPKTLARLACEGNGPVYQLIGRYPVYRAEDLAAWVEARTSPMKRSSSDPGFIAY